MKELKCQKCQQLPMLITYETDEHKQIIWTINCGNCGTKVNQIKVGLFIW